MKLGDFNLVDAGEDELIAQLEVFNDVRTDYPRNQTVHGLFAEQAARTPLAPAVFDEDRVCTYAELDAGSNRLAHLLIGRGVGVETPVAVMVEAPIEMVTALLGVLKAGAAYVPIDGDAPYERIKRLLRAARISVLVAEKQWIRTLNRLQWDCPDLRLLLCVDSDEVHAEAEAPGDMMNEQIWDEVARQTFDDISGGGWTSSYTGEWLSREVMDEYGENIRQKLAPYLGPRSRVLEIGCASGISLFRLAPDVAFYCGTDLSAGILEWTKQKAKNRGLANVGLHHLAAHETDRLPDRGFDLVVINSVIECFPGHNYLRQVLRQAIERMNDRGVIFLGNVWDQDAKDQFVDSLAAFARENAGKGYRTKVDRSEELFISRAFLDDLRHDFPEIASAVYSTMIGRAESELSKFGFDAVLTIDKTGRRDAMPARGRTQLDRRAIAASSDAAVPERTGPDGLAYIIHTSGTVGAPKGAMVQHRSVVRLVTNTNYVTLDASDRCLQTGSLAFDASTFELWGMLLNGGASCRPSGRGVLDPVELTRLIAKHGVTTMWLTAGLFNQLADGQPAMFRPLRRLLVGGERLSPRHVNLVRETCPGLQIVNGYGPTENTTFTTCFDVRHAYAQDIPIGKPIANTEVWILDSNMAPVPLGVAGEIHAGGDGLARGYLDDPALTAEKFVPHPFRTAQRLYRTGDLGRWLPDGAVEFIGRMDDQAKIRGFRIEPKEIEARLLEMADVAQSVVLARSLGAETALVAYVTGTGFDEEDVRRFLKSNLPDYMVPGAIVVLERMPLTANGKVDRRRLPEPDDRLARRHASYEPPRGETERALAAIWEDVLGRTGIGATDNFFDSGGHSLKVAKVISRVASQLGVIVPLSAIFKHQTVRELAHAVLDHARFGVDVGDEPVICVNPAGEARVFAFPPGTGDAAGFLQLAGMLPSHALHSFNFIESPGRMREYADLVCQAQPGGPLVLLGYSSGGNLAYHVARELEARGRDVSDIVMVDSGRKLQPTPFGPDEVERIADEFLDHESNRPYVGSPVLQEKARRRIAASYDWVAGAVDTHAIGANIHVILSAGALDVVRDATGHVVATKSGWAGVTRGTLKTYEGSGAHARMLYEPDLSRNAAIIRDILGDIGGSR